MIIGLTGSIGAGKSTVAKMFEELGANVVDADKIAHDLYEKGTECYKKILNYFGQTILNKNLEIDRKKLGFIVFNNKEKLQKLNKILHPRIRKEIESKILNNQINIIEAALLFESKIEFGYDLAVVVVTNQEKRYRRLIKRGMTHDKIISVMKNQTSQIEKIKRANYIIDNNFSLDKTFIQVKTVWQEIQNENSNISRKL